MIESYSAGPEFAYANADLYDATDEELESFAMVEANESETVDALLDTIQRQLDALGARVQIVVGDRGDDNLWVRVERTRRS